MVRVCKDFLWKTGGRNFTSHNHQFGWTFFWWRHYSRDKEISKWKSSRYWLVGDKFFDSTHQEHFLHGHTKVLPHGVDHHCSYSSPQEQGCQQPFQLSQNHGKPTIKKTLREYGRAENQRMGRKRSQKSYGIGEFQTKTFHHWSLHYPKVPHRKNVG